MAASFKVGEHVWADFGDGKVLAHIASEENAGKYDVQKPDGTVEQLGYREPADRDEHGSGRTFWKV